MDSPIFIAPAVILLALLVYSVTFFFRCRRQLRLARSTPEPGPSNAIMSENFI
jgi:hypothetical protein